MVKSTGRTEPTSQESSQAAQAVLEKPEPSPIPAIEPSDRPGGPSVQVRPVQPQIQFDGSKAVASYANFCRLTGTPEEMIIDFGLNTEPMGPPSEPIAATLRVIVNFYTAKRLLAALQTTVQRHEAAFGVLETDVQRRVIPNGLRQPAQSQV